MQGGEISNRRGGAGRGWPHHGQVVVLGGRPQAQQLLLVRVHSHEHAVEDVVVPFLRSLAGKAVQRACKQFPEAAGPWTVTPSPVTVCCGF